MDLLKKIFPFTFKDTKTNNGLIMSIIYHVVAAFVVILACTLISWVVGFIPVLGGLIAVIAGIIDSCCGLYATIGIVLACLNRFGIITD